MRRPVRESSIRSSGATGLIRLLALCAALLVSPLATGAQNDGLAQRTALYSRLADHSLLQIVLVAPTGRTSLRKTADGTWRLNGDVICLDTGPLSETVETRDVFELPDEARGQSIAGAEFYRAVRHRPPRILAPGHDTDFDADAAAALERFATAKLTRKVVIESQQTSTGCTADVVAVPAIRFQKRAGARTSQSAWIARIERGEFMMFGLVTINELRAARAQRLAFARRDNVTATAGPAAMGNGGPDALYGGLRVAAGRFLPCYVAGDDPFPALVAWTLAHAEKVKQWMGASAETPKMIAALDAIVGEFRKPAPQRQCTLLVAALPVLDQVKASLERDKLTATRYPESVSGRQVLAAYGFKTVNELQLARALGIESGEQFAVLRTLGIDTRDAYAKALERYMWSIGGAKPDVESVAAFVRDEREAVTRGISVKALRAERARREEDKVRKVTAALR